MTKWFIKNKKPETPIDPNQLGLKPWAYQFLVNRGLTEKEEIAQYLSPSLDNLHSPILLAGMVKAGNIMMEAAKKKFKIRIVGDYDVDGITSTTILLKGLRNLGFSVDYRIPQRERDGYGIKPSMVDEAHGDGIQLIITCDNGVAQFDAVARAGELKIPVIVLDHHETVKGEEGEVLPQAAALVDPKQEKDRYPFPGICGGFIAYKFISYLHTIFGKFEEFPPELHGLAALATVCDVMELRDENRDIVAIGLKYLEEPGSVGIRALKEVGSVTGPMEVFHLGFVLGPMLNAAGRLETADLGVELLMAEDEGRARELAQHLRALNQRRQQLTQEGVERGIRALEDPKKRAQSLYILKDLEAHESIAGLIAGKIKERFGRPTIVLTRGRDGLKGSGRSVENFHMVEELSPYRKYLTSFGGHAMACGLSLKEEQFEPFVAAVAEGIRRNPADFEKIYRADLFLPPDKLSFALMEELNQFKPFGNGNEAPLFAASAVTLDSYQIRGKRQNVIAMDLSYGGRKYRGVLFQGKDEFLHFLGPALSHKIPVLDLMYQPKVEEFRGNRYISLVIKDYRLSKRG
ncbi:MAG: single-stranded-DNA-specific exonuclease RecJ [Tissierellia bacterium]|nr:single-stranded-DNA-specific exonuclease RecJ [Tissierellia bacterium]